MHLASCQPILAQVLFCHTPSLCNACPAFYIIYYCLADMTWQKDFACIWRQRAHEECKFGEFACEADVAAYVSFQQSDVSFRGVYVLHRTRGPCGGGHQEAGAAAGAVEPGQN